MKQTLAYIFNITMMATTVICLFLLCACQRADDEGMERNAIRFCTDMAEQGQGLTRTATLENDFTVYGYKYDAEGESEVFPGWTVKHINGNVFDYIGVNGQTIKFWDPSATTYRFWAYTGNDWAADAENKSITIANRRLHVGRTGNAAEYESIDNNLYSTLCLREAENTSIVQLKFNHIFSQVGIYFYYEDMQPGVASVQIKNVRFAPVATAGKADRIYNKGNIKVTYPTSGIDGETFTLTVADDDTRPCLDFCVTSALAGSNGRGAANAIQAEIPNGVCDLILPDMPGEDLTRATEPVLNKFYYPLPMGSRNPAFELTLYLTELDAEGRELSTTKRSAVIPENFMHWQPNYVYRYYFKITEASLVTLYDVQIAPWKGGGSKTEEWKNW